MSWQRLGPRHDPRGAPHPKEGLADRAQTVTNSPNELPWLTASGYFVHLTNHPYYRLGAHDD
jgi:hypothetical protein